MLLFNNVLALFVELAALAACALWGWTRFDSTIVSALSMLACGGAFVMLWAISAAPRSVRRLAAPQRALFKAAVFAVATAALANVGFGLLATLFAAAAVLHLLLASKLETQ